MKAPKPAIPKGAAPGTVWFGGPIDWLSITLRIRGHDLDPGELTRTLGCAPSMAHRKGDPIIRADGTVARLAKTGAWHLDFFPEETDEWDCGEAMLLLIKRLPSDVALWKSMNQRFKIDLYVSLHMQSWNKGFALTPEVMTYLGERGIEAGFDVVYREEQVESDNVP